MEKISDFFKDLKDRLSNPLFSSFLIAWVIINWRVVVGLLFYKIEDLKIDGYKSYIDLIDRSTNINTNLIVPLCAAVGYTFAFPFIRNIILAFGAWIKRWGNDWTLNVSKDGSIKAANYIRLRSQYVNLIKSLTEITNAEGETQKKYNFLIHESIEKENQIQSLKDSLEKHRAYNSADILNGNWRFRIVEKNHTHKIDEAFRLGDTIRVINNDFIIVRSDVPDMQYLILSLVSNLQDAVLILEYKGGDRKKTVFTLQVSNNFNNLTGSDTFGNMIFMERINPKF